MDRMLYVAMSGAVQTLDAQAANAHNLANSATPGFKRDLSQFRSMPVFGPGLPTRVYALSERPGFDLNAGAFQSTARELDVAVSKDGWIAVQGRDGSEAYTKRGDLQLTVNGQLTTGAGHPVLGDGGPIALPPVEKVEIGADGTISVRPTGQDAKALAAVDRIKLVKLDPAGLVKGEDGLFRLEGGQSAPADANLRLASGTLEASNVGIVDALVEMIALARQFELQIKMMETAQQSDAAATGTLRLA
jgi:flagellar basal-body rod protein FlgF